MHYINRSVSQLIAALLFAATPCWRDLTRSKDLSTVAILGYQFGLYHVVVLLNFLCSNQPCFIVMFLFISDQTFYSSYLYRKYFRLRSALHLLVEKLVLTLERETSIFSMYLILWDRREAFQSENSSLMTKSLFLQTRNICIVLTITCPENCKIKYRVKILPIKVAYYSPRISSARYDCLPDVNTWNAWNHFGVQRDSFKLRSNRCFSLGPIKYDKKGSKNNRWKL